MPVKFEPPFTRLLNPGSPIERGIDIEGMGRALCRSQAPYMTLEVFNAMPARNRRAYGSGKIRAVNWIRKKQQRRQNGIYDREVHGYLIDTGSFDARGTNMMIRYEPPDALCYPIAKGFSSWICQDLHETGGVNGNWAKDFCVPEIVGNGAPILAVQDAWVYRLSGSDPNHDVPDDTGAFGWSVYLQTRSWLIYYVTHIGRRANLIPGMKLSAGDIIGWVGDQDFRPDHVHYGCTHPLGERAARAQMDRVGKAPRVTALAF
jgi:hypothetical protein